MGEITLEKRRYGFIHVQVAARCVFHARLAEIYYSSMADSSLLCIIRMDSAVAQSRRCGLGLRRGVKASSSLHSFPTASIISKNLQSNSQSNRIIFIPPQEQSLVLSHKAAFTELFCMLFVLLHSSSAVI